MINLEMQLHKDLEGLEVVAMRDGYGAGLLELGQVNEDVVVLCADLFESTRSEEFRKMYPERAFEMGVAEQNMMGVAAGMALVGKIPFVSSYAVFSPGRNWDQLRVSVCYTRVNVKIIGGHAGLSVGPDGATHQALEDVAITRALPNLVVMAPADAEQARRATIAAANISGPVYIRVGRAKSVVLTTKMTPFEVGRAQVLRSGVDISLIACGSLVYEALMAAEELKGEIDVEVINVHTIKPIDKETITKSASKTRLVVTVEEHQIIGGLGSAICEVLAENCPTQVRRMGVLDTFGESGEVSQLYKKYNLDRQSIIRTIREMKAKKQ